MLGATCVVGGVAGSAAKDDRIETGSGAAGSFANANGCVMQSSFEGGFEGARSHLPKGPQQLLATAEGNMKNWAQERQPPHNKVAMSATAIP